MQTMEKGGIGLWLRSGMELAAVALLVFAIGWIGVQAATLVHQRPIQPDGSGAIALRLVKSDRRGSMAFEEGPGYAGWWHCQGKDWTVEWRFAAEAKARYSVEMLVATPERQETESVEVVIRDQSTGREEVFETKIPYTGGSAKWKTVSCGDATLENGPYVLIVRPVSGRPGTLNVKSVTLRRKHAPE